MFLRENEEPHFHVSRAEEEYRFRLRDFEQMHTDTRRAPAGLARKVREWALLNSEALELAWRTLRAGGVPDKGWFAG